MIALKDGWNLHLDHGQEWLFFRLSPPSQRAMGEPPIAETVAAEVAASNVRRVVFEVDDQVMLFSYLVGQLVALHKRLLLEGGTFRVCGLSDENADILRVLHLSDRLPNYRDRGAAVMGQL